MIIKILTKLFGPAMGFRFYRIYWAGALISLTGFRVLTFSQFWVIHELTQSALYLGYVAIASVMPSVVLNLYGGILADRFNRKMLICCTHSLNALLILILGILIFTNTIHPWHVLVIAFLTGSVSSIEQPSFASIYPTLVKKHVLTNAVSLFVMIGPISYITGPAIAGLIISLTNTALAFVFSSLSLIIMAIFVLLLPTVPANSVKNSTKNDFIQGINYLLTNKRICFLILLSFALAFFGLSYIPMMPIFTVDILNLGADAQGIMMVIGGIGAVFASLIISRLNNLRITSNLILLGAFLFGILITIFGFTSSEFANYFLAVTLMFFIGFFASTFWVSITTSLQLVISESMRGRVMGMFGLTWNFPAAGGLYVAFIAGFLGHGNTSVPIVIASGGILIMLLALGYFFWNKQSHKIHHL